MPHGFPLTSSLLLDYHVKQHTHTCQVESMLLRRQIRDYIAMSSCVCKNIMYKTRGVLGLSVQTYKTGYPQPKTLWFGQGQTTQSIKHQSTVRLSTLSVLYSLLKNQQSESLVVVNHSPRPHWLNFYVSWYKFFIFCKKLRAINRPNSPFQLISKSH